MVPGTNVCDEHALPTTGRNVDRTNKNKVSHKHRDTDTRVTDAVSKSQYLVVKGVRGSLKCIHSFIRSFQFLQDENKHSNVVNVCFTFIHTLNQSFRVVGKAMVYLLTFDQL